MGHGDMGKDQDAGRGWGREVPQQDPMLRPSQSQSGAAYRSVGRRPGLTIDLAPGRAALTSAGAV